MASPGRQLAGCPIGQEMLQDGQGPTTGAVQDEPEAGFCLGACDLLVPQAATIAAISNSTTNLTATFMSAFPPRERCKGYRIGGT